MRKMLSALAVVGLVAASPAGAQAQNLLANGNLDVTYQQEIVPGFFLPKPANWVNEGFRTITGPYEDELSSEPWAGPAPTPVTFDGVNADDWGVFFKAFSGNTANGPATGHLYQDVPATPGLTYILSGWAGGEANVLMGDAQLAVEFLDAGGGPVAGGSVLSLLPTLTLPNGEAFNYKQYTVSALAPPGAAQVRARVSMIDGIPNPAGGGQAFVVDDFVLRGVPEPSSAGLALLGLAALVRRRSRR
ncbi:MAG TPA: PEP-CTERM sorting domain-containing protein [Lacipirellulaceae bacterium]|nr:PEP-CTERM sorting domain-containing protein [Lacipirellulaceae bacterium]